MDELYECNYCGRSVHKSRFHDLEDKMCTACYNIGQLINIKDSNMAKLTFNPSPNFSGIYSIKADENGYINPVKEAYDSYAVIHNPSHYTQGTIQPLDVIEDWKLGFHLGNCIKYIARAKYKGRELEDLKKARFYLDRYISNLSNNLTEAVPMVSKE